MVAAAILAGQGLCEGADGPAVLEGTVEDARTGQRIGGATVVVLPADGSTLSVVTDQAGRFTVSGIPPGAATVVIFGPRGAQAIHAQSFAGGERVARRYQLGAGDAGDEVIVVTSPGGAAQPVATAVEVEEARRVPGTQGDPLKVVSNLPGVGRPAPGATNPVIWGAAPEESRTLVDDIEVPSLYHLGGVRGVLSPALVSRIELVPGAYGAAYGRALGGLVRVTTAELPSDRPRGTVAADLLDAGASLTAPLSPRLRLGLAARYGYLDRLAGGLVDPQARALYPIPRYRDDQAKATVALRPGEEMGLTSLGGRDVLRTAIDAQDPASARSEAATLEWRRLGLRYGRALEDGSTVALTTFVGTTRSGSSTMAGDAGAGLAQRAVEAGLRASHAAPVTAGAAVTVGIDALLVRARLLRSGTLTIPPREGDRTTFGQPPGDDFGRDQWTATGGDVGLFASVAAHRPRWTVVPELRLDAFPLAGSRLLPPVGATPPIGYDRLDWGVDPRVSVVYQPKPSLAFTAAGGVYHQPVDLADLSAVFGAPALHPPRAWQGALGTWWRRGLVTVEVTAFGRLSSALVVRSELPSPPLAGALVQGGRGRAVGAQILVRRELAARLSGWASYTLARSERRQEGGGGYRLADFDQTHVLTTVVSWRVDRRGAWLVGGRGRYATGAPRTAVVGASYDLRGARWDPIFGPRNGTRLPSFLQLDVRIEHRMPLGATELALYLDVQNLTNHDNAEEVVYTRDYGSSGYIRGLPVLAVGGVVWRF